MNSLKQIALAMHNFHDSYGHFAPQSLVDDDGKRLLSWRVMILPFLGEMPLYKEFRLDEVSPIEYEVPEETTGSFAPADVVIDTDVDVNIHLEAANIPTGATVTVVVNPEDGDPITLTSDELTGTRDSSTATAGPVTLPAGFTRFIVTVSWTP